MIILVRHGQTVWNLEDRKQGRKDSPLTLQGIEQGVAIGKKIKSEGIKPDIIFVSPLMRAKQAAAIILETMEIPYNLIEFDDRIQEHSFGLWEGMTQSEVDEKYGPFVQARKNDWWNFIIPLGESYELLQLRVKEFLHCLNTSQTILIVCHEMVSKVIRGLLLNLDHQNTLELKHPQNTFYKIQGADIEGIVCE